MREAARVDPSRTPGPGETLDAVGRGEVVVLQHRSGYRFSIDAPLLAHFARGARGHAVDLGTGCGIVALLLARREGPALRVTGVEVQEGLASLARRSAELNLLSDRVRILRADLRRLEHVLPPASFDLVVSNPPYGGARGGTVNPSPERAIARHEVLCSLSDVASAAHRLLRPGGSLKAVFPSRREADLLSTLGRAGLGPRRMRRVHPVEGRDARLVLVEAVKGGAAALEILPPLCLSDGAGAPTAESLQVVGG